jgi:hypothetical protein
LAEFPGQADDGVVPLERLEVARRQVFEPGLPVVVGVDVARFGSDRSVVAVREGNRVRVVDVRQGRDTMQTAGRVGELCRQLHERLGVRPTVVVDDIGVGSGVTDRLRELAEFRVVAFNGSERARRPRDAVNRRSESWLQFAEIVELLDLDERDEELMAELLAPRYAFASSGARQVEAKQETRRRLRRSPDKADAVLLCFVVNPPRHPGRLAKAAKFWHVPTGSIDDHRYGSHPARRLLGLLAAADDRDPVGAAAAVRGDRTLGGRVRVADTLGESFQPSFRHQSGGAHPDLVADLSGAGCAGRITKAPPVDLSQGEFTWEGRK